MNRSSGWEPGSPLATCSGNFERLDEILHHLKPGDLLEIDRGIFNHWALYIGDHEVIHVVVDDGISGQSSGGVGSLFLAEARVKKEALRDVVGTDKVRVNNMEEFARRENLTARPFAEVYRIASERVGRTVEYNVRSRNCEHYVTEWKYRTPHSQQADDMVTDLEIAGLVVGVGALVAAGMTLFAGRSRQKEESKTDRDVKKRNEC